MSDNDHCSRPCKTSLLGHRLLIAESPAFRRGEFVKELNSKFGLRGNEAKIYLRFSASFKKSVNITVEKNLLERFQIFGVQSFGMSELVFSTKHVVFVFAELMKGQKLNAFCADLFESANKSTGVSE